MSPVERAIAPEEQQNVAGGIVLMVLAVFIYSANDALGKWLAGTYPVGQILLFRGAAAGIVLLPFIGRGGLMRFVRVERPGLQVVRVILATAELACFYLAVSALPLADTMTYYLASPIFVTVLAAFFLKEQVGWRRWIAVLVGFAGVALALRPAGGSIGWPTLAALVASTLFTFLMIVTRLLRATPDLVMVGWQVTGSLIVGAVTAPFTWVPMTAADAALLVIVGVVSMLAIACVNRSLKLAPASVVVPYQYTLIVWAAIFGYVVFGDLPAPAVGAGAAVIVGAGLFIFLREQKVSRRPRQDLLTER